VSEPTVRELRLVVTADDYDAALCFYRDVLGLTEQAAFASPDGRVTILEAGRATIELADPGHAAYIDEVEVGRKVAGHIRGRLRGRGLRGDNGQAGLGWGDSGRKTDVNALELPQFPARSPRRPAADSVHRTRRLIGHRTATGPTHGIVDG
jgi:catechol 2,3-dioxygenase-like lactoylglutathione lyase family enzyme